MIAGINSRIFRSHSMTVGVRQQVIARPNSVLSRSLVKKVSIVFCAFTFLVFALSQFLSWKIASASNEVVRLQAAKSIVVDENLALLAHKAKLVLKAYVVSQAQEKFRLFVPEKDQIQNLQ